MQVARPIVEFGINVAPVPGLKPAFILLTAIWDNVQLVCMHAWLVAEIYNSWGN